MPRSVGSYSAGRVLAMRYLAGRKITKLSPVYLTEDHRLALLDFGMVGYLPPGMQNQLAKTLSAIGDRRRQRPA